MYSLTEAGLGLLRAWVTEAPQPERTRDDLLLKAYAVWTADPGAAGACSTIRSPGTASA